MKMLLLYLVLIAATAEKSTKARKPKGKATKESAAQEPNVLSAEEESMQLKKEWSDRLKGFSPEEMVNFVIGSRAEEEFFELIDIVPSVIRGIWFLESGESKDIDFEIYDPQKTLLYERKSSRELIFYTVAEIQGTYIFKFINNRIIQSMNVVFAYDIGNSTNKILKSENIGPVETKLIEIQNNVKEFQVESQFAQLRQESHYKTVASANKSLFWLSIAECVGVVAVTGWQIYYIKKLLDNSRVL